MINTKTVYYNVNVWMTGIVTLWNTSAIPKKVVTQRWRSYKCKHYTVNMAFAIHDDNWQLCWGWTIDLSRSITFHQPEMVH